MRRSFLMNTQCGGSTGFLPIHEGDQVDHWKVTCQAPNVSQLCEWDWDLDQELEMHVDGVEAYLGQKNFAIVLLKSRSREHFTILNVLCPKQYYYQSYDSA